MTRPLNRLALGKLQEHVSVRPMLAAMVSALAREGHTSQLFLGRSIPGQSTRGELASGEPDLGRVINSRATRQLDSWTMTRPHSRHLFVQGCRDATFGIVHGDWRWSDTTLVGGLQHGKSQYATSQLGGSLDQLSRWLDLARIAVVDASAFRTSGLPRRLTTLDGILLDNVDASDLIRLQVECETLWGAKVLGWLPRNAESRQQFRLAGSSSCLTKESCDSLGNLLLESLDLDQLTQLAGRQNRPCVGEPSALDNLLTSHTSRPLRMAIAWDEDFTGYFPDTIDRLEAAGAKLTDFSPRRCERIPDDCDLVYIGGARPQAPWQRIAANHCLMQSLRAHAGRGGRVYAEAEGAGLLCREIKLASGSLLPMAGLLPMRATQLTSPQSTATPPPPSPVMLEPKKSSWLLGSWSTDESDYLSDRIRAYDARTWKFDADRSVEQLAVDSEGRALVVGRGQVIASQAWLHFAASATLLGRLLESRSVISDWAPQLR